MPMWRAASASIICARQFAIIRLAIRDSLRPSATEYAGQFVVNTSSQARQEAAAVTDPHVLDYTGFELRREASATNPLGAQINLSVTHGKYPGVIITKTAKVPGAASYEIHFTEGNPLDADWPLKKVYPNASYMEMAGLNGGSMYSVRGRVISGAGEGPWSDAVTIRVL